MPRYILLLAFAFYCFPTLGQIKAITEEGDEVLLSDNGTWAYVSKIKKAHTIIPDTVYEEKSSNATFLVKGKKVNYGVYVNPKKWKFEKPDNGDAIEYDFQHKTLDIYASTIPEQIPIPFGTLKGLALENIRSSAPDANIIEEGVRVVNGILVHSLVIKATIQGINFTYLGYYYCSDLDTIQFVAYTSDNLFAKHRKEIEEFLKGFTIID